MTQPKNRLTNLRVGEVSLVDDGDNPGARVVMFKRRTRTNRPGAPGYDPQKARHPSTGPTSGSAHVDGPIGEPDRPRRRPRRRRGAADGANRLAKLSEQTSADGVGPHAHDVELPDGAIAAGTFRTAPAQGRTRHTHDFVLPDLQPGQTADVTTSQVDGHTHSLRVTAVERVTRRRQKGHAMKLLDRFYELIGRDVPDEEIEKRLFDEIRAETMSEQIGDAVMTRVGDFARSVRSIMFGPEEDEDGNAIDKQALVATSLGQFVDNMDGELPDIFAGRIVKLFDDDDEDLDDAEVEDRLRSFFTDEPPVKKTSTTKEGPMDLTKLTKEDRVKVEAALEKAGGVEKFLAANDAAVKKTDDLETRATAQGKEIAKLKRAITGEDEPAEDPLEGLDDDVRKLVEPALKSATEAGAKLTKENADLKKRLDKLEGDSALTTFGKSVGDLTGLPQKRDDLVDLLWTMDDEKARESMQKNLEAAAAAARRGNVFGNIGSDLAGGDTGSAYAKIQAAAVEIKKANPKLTVEQARAQAMNDNPELYDAYLDEDGPPQLN